MSSSRMHSIARWLAGALVIGALVALFIHRQTESVREVRSMPTAERRALYQRTLEILNSACAGAPGPTVEAYCRNQAEFIGLFPECDPDCRARVRQLTSSPTR